VPAPAPVRQRWWHELVIVAVFYGLYTLVRDLNRSTDTTTATRHAHLVVRIERDLGVFVEARIQHVFVHHHAFMRFWDGYYGTAHFVVAAGVLVYLFARRPDRYRLWRNTLAVMTGLALLGFYLFPLLPPRLLPATYGFTDTLQTIGGFWDFHNGPVNAVSNQYAAMPSLHTGWSLWCAAALWGCVRTPLRPLLLLYPCATVFCIVVTANHYLADAAGGALALALGFGGAKIIGVVGDRWRLHRAAARVLREGRVPVSSA
jgi:hypothetical protein